MSAKRDGGDLKAVSIYVDIFKAGSGDPPNFFIMAKPSRDSTKQIREDLLH